MNMRRSGLATTTVWECGWCKWQVSCRGQLLSIEEEVRSFVAKYRKARARIFSSFKWLLRLATDFLWFSASCCVLLRNLLHDAGLSIPIALAKQGRCSKKSDSLSLGPSRSARMLKFEFLKGPLQEYHGISRRLQVLGKTPRSNQLRLLSRSLALGWQVAFNRPNLSSVGHSRISLWHNHPRFSGSRLGTSGNHLETVFDIPCLKILFWGGM